MLGAAIIFPITPPHEFAEAISTGLQSGPEGNAEIDILYCAINPHTGIRANLFSSGTTAFSTAPPTFSKYTSTPLGQAALSSCANEEPL